MSKAKQNKIPGNVLNIGDLRTLAKRRLPGVVFDYLDGGAEGEVTLRENCRVFEDVTFRPHQATAVHRCELRTSALGSEFSLPILLAPVGYSRLMHPDGEIAAARAATVAGTGYILSTISGHPMERLREASSGTLWYQLYFIGGRAAAEGALARAKLSGFSALVVTIDTPIAGIRERDLRKGMKELLAGSVLDKLPFLPQFFTRPGWVKGFLLDGGVPKLENVIVPGQGPMQLIDISTAFANAMVTWEDFRWLRQLWTGPIVVKGVLTAEDARRAVGEGAAAIVVSNHGGRQLDSVQASLRALPEVVAAVNGEAEVFMDGGVRRGSDVVKALCLGARAVLIGRAYAYGLAAAGEAGVSAALRILRADIERTLILLGCSSAADLNPSYVNVPAAWKN